MTTTYEAPLSGSTTGIGAPVTPMIETFGKAQPRISKLAEALAKAQSEFTPVPKLKTATVIKKDGSGKFTYVYADLADVLSMALPVLARNGLALTQPLVRKADKLYVTTRLLHSSGEVLEDDGIFIPENIQPQQFGTYISYYRRYSAASLLGIAPDADTDGALAEPEKAPAPPPRGRPRKEEPVQKTDKRTEFNPPFEAPTEPAPAPSTFQATDEDVPSNIGDKPTKEEMKEYSRRIREYKVDQGQLGAYIKRTTGAASAQGVTKQQWVDLFKVLDGAKDQAALLEIIK